MTSDAASISSRSPLLGFLLIWLTGGGYLFWWLHRTMLDLNGLTEQDSFDMREIQRAAIQLLVSFLAFPALFAALVFTAEGILGLHLSATTHSVMAIIAIMPGFLLIGGILYLHCAIALAIADRYAESDLPGGPSLALTVALFFVGYAALPYLQAKMNRLVPPTNGLGASVERSDDT